MNTNTKTTTTTSQPHRVPCDKTRVDHPVQLPACAHARPLVRARRPDPGPGAVPHGPARPDLAANRVPQAVAAVRGRDGPADAAGPAVQGRRPAVRPVILRRPGRPVSGR